MSRTEEIYSIWEPDLTLEEISKIRYDHWRFPTSIEDVFYFIRNFNGESQPITHDYPFLLPLITIPLYLALVYFGPKIMEKREAFKLTGLLKIWNLFLTVLSVIMFFGLFQPMSALFFRKGIYNLICLPEKDLIYGSPFCMIWIFCLSKYIELVDTLILILRKRHVEFLHWYHHTTVLVYTWYSVATLGTPGSIFGMVNSFVHSFMYFYFFLTSFNYRPSWGKIITKIQILQMLVGIVASALWSYYYFISSKNCPYYYDPVVFFTSTLVLYGSYFFLFYQFYRKRYQDAAKAKADKEAANAKGNSTTKNQPKVKKDQ